MPFIRYTKIPKKTNACTRGAGERAFAAPRGLRAFFLLCAGCRRPFIARGKARAGGGDNEKTRSLRCGFSSRGVFWCEEESCTEIPVSYTHLDVYKRQEYIRKYRFANAFHPFHGVSMMSCGHLAEEHTSAIYIVGAREPGIARGMGLKTRATFEEALEDAKKKFVGDSPNILALPQTFTTAAVNLCMNCLLYTSRCV